MRGASRLRCRRPPPTPASAPRASRGRSAHGTGRTRRPRRSRNAGARSGSAPPSAAMRLASAISAGSNNWRAPMKRSTRSRNPGEKKRASPVASIEVNTRNGLRANCVCIDRPERRGDHRNRRRRVAQVVEADRIHAERGEQVGDVGEFAGAADADRAVAFGGHPVQRAQPFAAGTRCRAVAIHFAADLDERGVGGHLGAVHARQRRGEFRAQLPGFDAFDSCGSRPSPLLR